MQESTPSKQPDNRQAAKPTDQPAVLQMLRGFVQPWQESLVDPATAQNRVLQSLAQSYTLPLNTAPNTVPRKSKPWPIFGGLFRW